MKRMYERLASVPFLSKSYTVKFLFIAFLGIHIPLIGLIVFLLAAPDRLSAGSVLILTLTLTLIATATTLWVLNGLLYPLRQSRQTLDGYRKKRVLPQLPTHYRDEAGLLMQNIQFTLTELNDLLEEKKDLTALLSHDLRIPLRNVKTFAQLLKNESQTPAVIEIADLILASANEQSLLLEDILEILRQDHLFYSSQYNIKVKAEVLLEEALQALEPMALQKQVALKRNICVDEELEVQPELFKQVLKNLASNAIKFSNSGSSITFSVYQQEGKKKIEVKDEGIGFEPEMTERLFDRFTKSGRKGTDGEPTTGIGLYLSRKIVRHHNGELQAKSEGAGKGATFSILW